MPITCSSSLSQYLRTLGPGNNFHKHSIRGTAWITSRNNFLFGSHRHFVLVWCLQWVQGKVNAWNCALGARNDDKNGAWLLLNYEYKRFIKSWKNGWNSDSMRKLLDRYSLRLSLRSAARVARTSICDMIDALP